MSDEKHTADLESQTAASASTVAPPNNTHLETEKLETASLASSADYDHEEVEAMDAGHQTDLKMAKVCFQSCSKSRIIY